MSASAVDSILVALKTIVDKQSSCPDVPDSHSQNWHLVIFGTSSLSSSAKIEKTLNSLYSETMPVTIPSARKQINLFVIDFNIYFALQGASKVCLFKTLSLAVTQAKIHS